MEKILSYMAIMLLLVSLPQPVAAEVPQEGLIFHAPLNGRVEPLLARGDDGAKAGKNLKFVKDDAFGDVADLPFDKDVYLNYSFTRNIDPEKGTIMLWVKPHWPAALGTGNPILIYCGMFIHAYFNTHAHDWTCFFYKEDGNVNQPVETPQQSFQPDKWQHIAITWDVTSGARIYINGLLVVENKMQWRPHPAISGEFGIGQKGPGIEDVNHPENTPFAGSMSNLYIYDRELTKKEIYDYARSTRPAE